MPCFLIWYRYIVEKQSTLVNKQIAYLLGISLETDQIRIGKVFLYVIAAGLVQTASFEAVLVQQGLSLMD
jgi:hypothetical protein